MDYEPSLDDRLPEYSLIKEVVVASYKVGMREEQISIAQYRNSDRLELLRLLLELHSNYFDENASQQLRELNQEVNNRTSFEKYLDSIEQNKDDTWRIFVAETIVNKLVGFIIGSIKTDEYLMLNKIAVVEDWYVEPHFREQGIGINLYHNLEKWFKETGCHQIQSDTWYENQLSIKAHKQVGFFISGIKFSKKL